MPTALLPTELLSCSVSDSVTRTDQTAVIMFVCLSYIAACGGGGGGCRPSRRSIFVCGRNWRLSRPSEGEKGEDVEAPPPAAAHCRPNGGPRGLLRPPVPCIVYHRGSLYSQCQYFCWIFIWKLEFIQGTWGAENSDAPCCCFCRRLDRVPPTSTCRLDTPPSTLRPPWPPTSCSTAPPSQQLNSAPPHGPFLVCF